MDFHFSMREESKKHGTMWKLVISKSDGRILGLHGAGRGVDEATQGFAVAIKMGAKKSDFDATIPIHPTVSEKFVDLETPSDVAPSSPGRKSHFIEEEKRRAPIKQQHKMNQWKPLWKIVQCGTCDGPCGNYKSKFMEFEVQCPNNWHICLDCFWESYTSHSKVCCNPKCNRGYNDIELNLFGTLYISLPNPPPMKAGIVAKAPAKLLNFT